MKDNGGWRSRGIPLRCPKCGEDGMQIETTIYGKTKTIHFCNTCAHDWPERQTDVSGNQIDGP